jgi:SsrA-binding protein
MAGKLIAENRRARFDYFLEDTFEAGIMLTGSEVKSLRVGRANIAESYAAIEGDEVVLINADIPPFAQANRFNHEPRRHRKLLLHRKQLDKLIGAVQRDARSVRPSFIGTKRAWPSWRSPWRRARSCTTSARPPPTAIGPGTRPACCATRASGRRSHRARHRRGGGAA